MVQVCGSAPRMGSRAHMAARRSHVELMRVSVAHGDDISAIIKTGQIDIQFDLRQRDSQLVCALTCARLVVNG